VRPRSVGTHGGYTNFIRYSILWVNLNLRETLRRHNPANLKSAYAGRFPLTDLIKNVA